MSNQLFSDSIKYTLKSIQNIKNIWLYSYRFLPFYQILHKQWKWNAIIYNS